MTETNELPSAEQIKAWLGDGWEFCNDRFQRLRHEDLTDEETPTFWYEPGEHGWDTSPHTVPTLYLRHTSGRRVTVEAPPDGFDTDEADNWFNWIRLGGEPDASIGGHIHWTRYSENVTFHDASPESLRVGQVVEDASVLPDDVVFSFEDDLSLPFVIVGNGQPTGPQKNGPYRVTRCCVSPMPATVTALPSPPASTGNDRGEADVCELGELERGEHFEFAGAYKGHCPGLRVVLCNDRDGGVWHELVDGSDSARCYCGGSRCTVRRISPPTQASEADQDLAGGSSGAAVGNEAEAVPGSSPEAEFRHTEQPPAVCSKCGVPESKYTRVSVGPGDDIPLCTDCACVEFENPGHAPQHPTSPEPERAHPSDWEVFATSGWEWP